MSYSVVVAPGKYYLCDPCYCFDHKNWGVLLSLPSTMENGYVFYEYPSGDVILAFSTLEGDGVYEDQFDTVYGVDSGLIGIVPVNRATKPADDLEDLEVIEFGGFTICSSENGVLTFGRYEIDTNFDEELEELDFNDGVDVDRDIEDDE